MNRPRADAARLLVAPTLVLVLVMGGAATAYWKSTGTGVGAAATGIGAPLRLDPGTATPGLYPGGVTAVTLTVTNPNPSVVRFGSLSLDTTRGTAGFAVDSQHQACPTSSLSFTTQNNSGAGYAVPAASGGADGVLPLSLTGALAMGADAANACQGARFNVYLMASP